MLYLKIASVNLFKSPADDGHYTWSNYNAKGDKTHYHNSRNVQHDHTIRKWNSENELQNSSENKQAELKPNSSAPLILARRKKSRIAEIRTSRKINRRIGMQCSPSEIISILRESERRSGKRLVEEFLKAEKEYCKNLKCLMQWYFELSVIIGVRKMPWSRSDLDNIYRHLPELAKFHKNFYNTLKSNWEISGFDFFEVYCEYMQNCSNMIEKMRDYSMEKKLQKNLEQIQLQSFMPEVELVDLLLAPLKRIAEYKLFMDMLVDLGDKAQQENWYCICTAHRKVVKVANYIEEHSSVIYNINRMNKAQQWLGKQCKIWSKDRVLLRQGNVNCRAQGWTARSKICVFFLFNDILLWTSKKGELQSVNYIKNCNIRPSDSKIYPEKKFQVIFLNNKTRTLIVECNNKDDRDEWYNAIFKVVLEANSLSSEGFFEQRSIEGALGLDVKDSAWVKAEARLKVSEEQKRDLYMHYGSSALRGYKTGQNRDDFAARSSRDSEATETISGKWEYKEFDLLAPCREASVPLDNAENSCCSKQCELMLEDAAELSNVFADKDVENWEELSSPLSETQVLRSSLTQESSSSIYVVQRDKGKTSEERNLHKVNESPLPTWNLKSRIARQIERNNGDLPTLEKPVTAPTALRQACALPRAVEAKVSQPMGQIQGKVATAFTRSAPFTIRRLKSV